jgi:DNA repair exonuclease SbcCD ATPase subunit
MPTKKNPDELPTKFDTPNRDPAQAKLEMVDARIEVLDQRLSGQIEQLIKTVDNLAVQVGQLNGAIKLQSQNVDKLGQTIDRLAQTIENGFSRLERLIESDREFAKLQAGNVQQMVALAAQQQQTVNTLVAKLAT